MRILQSSAHIGAAMAALGLTVSTQAGEFKFPVGIAYTQGAFDVIDKLDETWNYEDKFVWPVGLTFNPYYEFDFGLGIGLNFGPATFIVVDMYSWDNYYDYDNDTRFSYIVPIGADVRYTFLRKKSVSPYVRVGIRYPIAGGDDIDSSTPGPFGAVGVEFWRNKSVGLAVEVGYDGSQVEVIGKGGTRRDDVTYSGFMVSIQAVF
jgi:hypothetical protein